MLRVDPATKLLSAIELKIDPAQRSKSAPPGQALSIEQFGWTAGTISTQVAADRSFAFVAPKGFGPIEGIKAQPGGAGQAPKYAVQEKLGKPAPDFSLTLLDGPNKTRTMTKADLAGKVVLIDFWATWCGPCLMELPEIQKLVEHYKDAKKDVLVVALSQDSEPQEISEVRKAVEKTLADKKIDLTRGPAGRIGLDPSNSVGKAFDVEGYPTLVILDAKGIVQSATSATTPTPPNPCTRRWPPRSTRSSRASRWWVRRTRTRKKRRKARGRSSRDRRGPDCRTGRSTLVSFVLNHRRVPTGSRSRTVMSRVPSSWL